MTDTEFMELYNQLTEANKQKMLDVIQVMLTPELNISFNADGTAVISWPEGYLPDMDTINRATNVLNELVPLMTEHFH